MFYIEIAISTTHQLASLVQDKAYYEDQIARCNRRSGESGVQYAETDILMKEVRVFGRYLKTAQHEIDTLLTSPREQIRFAKNNVKELSDDADLLYASIEDDVQARIGDYLFRLAGEEDEIASIKREIGSCCSHVIRRCAEERLELHEDEQRELEFALHCELMQLLNAFVTAKPKSDL